MKTLGNIIWVLFGGFMIAIEYFIAGFLMMITIIGIPFGIQAFKMGGMLALWPFGSKVVTDESSSGCLSFVMNVIWIIIGGFWIALTHLFWGCFILYYYSRHSVRNAAFQTDSSCPCAFW